MMPRAKLSGALLVRKDARAATTPAQDLDTTRDDADEKALGGPVLVWSAGPRDEAEPTTAEDTGDAVHRPVAAPQATDLDPPAIEATAGSSPDNAVPAPAWRRTGFGAVAVAVSFLALGSVSGLLFLQPNEAKRSTETALSVAPPTAAEKLTSGGVEPEQQPPAKAATVVPSQGALDSAVASAAPAGITPHEALPDHPSTGAAVRAEILALPDPAVPDVPQGSGATPNAKLSVSTANSSASPAEPPGSAALNSALLARGDALFVIGDFSAARMLYERAANSGHGQAALRLGETYDPAFLARTRFAGARANAAIASYWYERARELDVPEANILLKAIAAETGYSSP
jgi:hypothetical protein